MIFKKNATPWRFHCIVLGGYLLLALLLTWPTITQPTTHLPGDGGDDPAIAWNLWWIKYALLNEGQNPFQTDMMFYPIGINLAFYTLTLLNGLTAIPLTLNFGVVTASNLHMWLTFIVAGYGLFLLARQELQILKDKLQFSVCDVQLISCFIAGGIYAFASSKLFYVALGQFNIASTHWIPFAILFIIRMRQKPEQLSNALLAGLFFTMQAWAEMTYASFLVVFMVIYWGWEGIMALIRQTNNLNHHLLSFKPHLIALILMGMTIILGISPILSQMIPDMVQEGDFLVEGSGFAEDFSADLLGFFMPTMHHPLWGAWISQTNIDDFTKGQHIYLGYSLFFLGLLALITPRGNRHLYFWLSASLIFALLCLGPTIIINGYNTNISGPFVIFQDLPFFKGNRYPSRYAVMLILCLSMVALYGLQSLQISISKLKWQDVTVRLKTFYLLSLALFLLFLFEHLAVPLPQSNMHLPSAYQPLVDDPGKGTVLDIPFAWRNGFRITGALTTQFMFGQFYQTSHQKPMLQGNTSRNPTFKFQYFTSAPIINSLLALQTGKSIPAERWQYDKAIATEVLSFFNIKYIVVRPDASGSEIVTPQATIPYIETVLPITKIHSAPEMTIYQVKQTSLNLTDGWTVEPTLPTAPLYFGEGWGIITPNAPLHGQRQAMRIFLPLTSIDQRIVMTLKTVEDARPSSAWLRIDGWQSPKQSLTNSWVDYHFDIPAQAIEAGLNEIWLQTDSQTEISSSLLDVTVVSAGHEVGNFGHIFVNGNDVSPNELGLNVAVIQPNHIETATFNTHSDHSASAKLAQFLQTIPPKAILTIVVADEASLNLGEDAVQALQSIGATVDLRGCFRCSYGFIRQADGVIQEQVNPIDAVYLTTALGATEPTTTLQLRQIRILPYQ